MKRVELDLHGRRLSIESGRVAKQANGSVLVQYGDTVVLVTAVAARGAVAFVERLAPNAPVLVPGAPLYRGAASARTPILARYAPADGSASFSWTPQHAVTAR